MKSVDDLIEDVNKGVVQRKRSFWKRSKQVPWVSLGKEGDKNLDIPFGFSPQPNRMEGKDSVEEAKPTLEQILGDYNKENSLDSKPSSSSDIANPAQNFQLQKQAVELLDRLSC